MTRTFGTFKQDFDGNAIEKEPEQTKDILEACKKYLTNLRQRNYLDFYGDREIEIVLPNKQVFVVYIDDSERMVESTTHRIKKVSDLAVLIGKYRSLTM